MISAILGFIENEMLLKCKILTKNVNMMQIHPLSNVKGEIQPKLFFFLSCEQPRERLELLSGFYCCLGMN